MKRCELTAGLGDSARTNWTADRSETTTALLRRLRLFLKRRARVRISNLCGLRSLLDGTRSNKATLCRRQESRRRTKSTNLRRSVENVDKSLQVGARFLCVEHLPTP